MLTRNLLAEMEVMERERTRIASDLHDELGPLLAMTKIQLEQLQPQTDTEKQRHANAVQNLVTLMHRSGEIARNLTPKVLLTKGLQTALADFVEQFSEVSKMKMKLNYRLVSKPSSFYALQIFRIVQELVYNAVKHSEAENLHIELREYKRKLYLFYTDDGKGIERLKATIDGTRLGLNSLQNRAYLLGGKMKQLQPQIRGTEFLFELPIQIYDERKDPHHRSR
ncbi:sensor histidine kinase [Lacibacter luteus]|nr:histidine kinase [Lacibacter luteus]